MRALAARAADDPAALAALEQVDTVDGVPVDLRRALAGAAGAELRARLSALAAPSRASETGDPRADAERILAGRRFHTSSVPRPLHGALHWLGGRLRTLLHWLRPLGKPFRWLADRIPGGTDTLLAILGAVVLSAAAWTAVAVARRRAAAALAGGTRRRGRSDVDPAALEHEADEAERLGDLERALRLRFRAGLARLAQAKAIPPDRSLTTGAVRRALGDADFDGLARSFDEVVYGRRRPSPADVEAAKARWPAVLEHVSRR